MNDKAQACGSDSRTELGAVGWRYVPSDVWGDQVLTQDPKAARLARDFGRDVESLYTEAQLLARVAAERERWQEVVFDGWRVLQGLDDRARKRTSHQNVSDTLDALVRVMKPNTANDRL